MKPHKIVIKITVNVGNVSDVEVKCDSDGVGNKPAVDVKCELGSVDNAVDTAKNKNAGVQAGLQRPPEASLAEPVAGSENADVQVGIMDGVEQCPEIPQKNSQGLPKNDRMSTIARHIPITPLDAFILHMLHFSNRDMTADEISDNVRKWFGETKSIDIRISLVDILVDSLMYVNERRVNDGDGNLLKQYAVSKKAKDVYFSSPRNNQRSRIVMETMSQIVEEQRRMGRYCYYNLTNSVKHLPGLMVLEPDTYQSGNVTFYSPDRWNGKLATAVDIKINPNRHPGQIYKNWKKSADMNIDVFFVVFDKKHVDAIKNILDKNNVEKTSYSIRVIRNDVIRNKKAGDQEITQLPDHQYIPECAPKSVLKDTLNPKPLNGPRVKNTPPIDGAPAGKPANPVQVEFSGKSTVVHKAGVGPAKKKEKNADTEPADKLKNLHVAHMSDLERDIYNSINEGLSIGPDDIRERLGKKEHVSDSSIIDAVRNLRKKQYVFMKQQLYGDEHTNNYYKKLIMLKVASETVPDPKIGRAKIVPTGKVDDTTMTKMVVYSDAELEKMGLARLRGLLRSDRTTKRQKEKIMEVMKKKGRGIGNDPPAFNLDLM